MWDQIPMLLSRTTRRCSPAIGTGVLDDRQCAAGAGAGHSASPWPRSSTSSRTSSRPGRAGTSREGGVRVPRANAELTVTANVRHTNRDGTIPFGGSFGHSSLVEMPAPTEHTLTEVDAGAEFVRDRVLLRGRLHRVLLPQRRHVGRSSTIRSARPTAPRRRREGRLTLRAEQLVHRRQRPRLGEAAVPLARERVRLRRARSRTPAIRSCRRRSIGAVGRRRSSAPTVDGEARTSAINLTFVSRPTRYVDFTAGYRTYDYDNRTPEFAMTQRVSYDNSVVGASVPPVQTEPFGVSRHTFDADFTAHSGGRALRRRRLHATRRGADPSHLRVDDRQRRPPDVRHGRARQWFTLRTKYEHAQRRGKGIEEGEAELAAIGEQPGMRHFDIAARDRNRVTILGVGRCRPRTSAVERVGRRRQGRLPARACSACATTRTACTARAST